jgi:hypothetical protein
LVSAIYAHAANISRHFRLTTNPRFPRPDLPYFRAHVFDWRIRVRCEDHPGSKLSVNLRLRPERGSFRIDEEFHYEVETGEEGYLYLLVFSEKNQATCMFPNSHLSEGRNTLLPGGTHCVPPASSENYKAQLPIGKDVVIAFLTKTKLSIGEREDYAWDEIFGRLCSQKFFEYVKARGIDTGRVKPLEQADGRAVYLTLETIE